ncbi:hypothetical protein CPB97_006381, partial [Podila verticillata]
VGTMESLIKDSLDNSKHLKRRLESGTATDDELDMKKTMVKADFVRRTKLPRETREAFLAKIQEYDPNHPDMTRGQMTSRLKKLGGGLEHWKTTVEEKFDNCWAKATKRRKVMGPAQPSQLLQPEAGPSSTPEAMVSAAENRNQGITRMESKVDCEEDNLAEDEAETEDTD